MSVNSILRGNNLDPNRPNTFLRNEFARINHRIVPKRRIGRIQPEFKDDADRLRLRINNSFNPSNNAPKTLDDFNLRRAQVAQNLTRGRKVHDYVHRHNEKRTFLESLHKDNKHNTERMINSLKTLSEGNAELSDLVDAFRQGSVDGSNQSMEILSNIVLLLEDNIGELQNTNVNIRQLSNDIAEYTNSVNSQPGPSQPIPQATQTRINELMLKLFDFSNDDSEEYEDNTRAIDAVLNNLTVNQRNEAINVLKDSIKNVFDLSSSNTDYGNLIHNLRAHNFIDGSNYPNINFTVGNYLFQMYNEVAEVNVLEAENIFVDNNAPSVIPDTLGDEAGPSDPNEPSGVDSLLEHKNSDGEPVFKKVETDDLSWSRLLDLRDTNYIFLRTPKTSKSRRPINQLLHITDMEERVPSGRNSGIQSNPIEIKFTQPPGFNWNGGEFQLSRKDLNSNPGYEVWYIDREVFDDNSKWMKQIVRF